MSTKQDGVTFTARDFELLAGAIGSCTKSPVEVDYKKMAKKFSLKNSASAKASWNGLKKKLEKMGSGTVAPSLSITAGPGQDAEKKSKGKKRKAADGDEEEAEETEDAEAAKPKKKGRKAPIGGGSKAMAVAPVSDDQDDDEEPMQGLKAESAD